MKVVLTQSAHVEPREVPGSWVLTVEYMHGDADGFEVKKHTIMTVEKLEAVLKVIHLLQEDGFDEHRGDPAQQLDWVLGHEAALELPKAEIQAIYEMFTPTDISYGDDFIAAVNEVSIYQVSPSGQRIYHEHTVTL